MDVTWPTRKLRDLADIRVSNVDKKVQPNEKAINLCNYMDVYSNEYVSNRIQFMEGSASTAEIDRFGLNCGDVIITKDSETPDDIGISTVIVEEIPNLVCGYHLALIRPNINEIDPIYLAKQLSTSAVARYFAIHASGSTRYGLPIAAIESTEIATPPKNEQIKIAEILSTVDRGIEQTEAVIAKQQRIKTGLMQNLLTLGIDEHGNLRSEETHKFKDSQLGRIPVEWKINKLLDIVALAEGQKDPRKEPYCNWPLVAPDHVESKTGLLLNLMTAREQRAISGKYEFAPGDIVYSKIRPYLRKAVLVDFTGLCSADMYPMRPKGEIVSEFILLTILGEQFSKYAESVSERSGFPKINRSELAGFLVVTPPNSEQKRISDLSNEFAKSLQLETKKLNKLRSLKKALMQDLLTGEKRVTHLTK